MAIKNMSKRQFLFFILVFLFSANFAGARDLWHPSDFEGVYVQILDEATNGCWTNIRETRAYAEGQLELAGFEIVDTPQFKKDEPHPILVQNIVEYRIHVNASRQDNGVCVGFLNSSFWAAVAPGYDRSKLIVGQIGRPYIWSVWNSKNLNQYLFDQVKDPIKAWVKFGETPLFSE